MNRRATIVLSVIAGAAIGALLYLALSSGSKSETSPVHTGPEIVKQPLDAEAFMRAFDLNEQGRVTRDEFIALYDAAKFPIGVDGQPPLSAEEAFRRLDRNNDGVITPAELRHFSDSAWRRFEEHAQSRGLVAREWDGGFIALNGPQERQFAREIGADARNELPVGGSWFDARYVETWAEVRSERHGTIHAWVSTHNGVLYALEPHFEFYTYDYDPQVEATVAPEQRKLVLEWAAPPALRNFLGRSFSAWGSYIGGANQHEGLLSYSDGRITIAQPMPTLRAFSNPASLEITYLPDAPQTVYGRAVRELRLDDVKGNLELAQRCARWDMPIEALTLYMRVLIFDPHNSEALAYWGMENRDGHFAPQRN